MSLRLQLKEISAMLCIAGGVVATSDVIAQQALSPEAVRAADMAFYAPFKRTEIKRSDLTGTNMEVVLAVLEIPPGAVMPRHIHYGQEVFFMLGGAMTELLSGAPQVIEEGSGGIVPRELPHSGYRVVGDKPLKVLTVHIVDKGKPISTVVP